MGQQTSYKTLIGVYSTMHGESIALTPQFRSYMLANSESLKFNILSPLPLMKFVLHYNIIMCVGSGQHQ